jgi:hypothetical protein
MKFGAFNPCTACGYEPNSDEDKAKHLMVTDHYLSPEQLHELGERIKTGAPVNFKAEDIASFTKTIQEGKGSDFYTGVYVYGCFGIGVLILFGAIYVYYLLTRL